jgi:hypothetical protein
MIQTLAFNARLPVLLGASPFYRTPNSPIARGFELHEDDFFKARLTALAVESNNFARDDIYTLFVTTRILNFLKGLPITESASLAELINQRWSDQRTRIGFELLIQLEQTKQLYFSTSHGLVENQHFRNELLFRVFSEVGAIACQNGESIDISEFARRPAAHVATATLPYARVQKQNLARSADSIS